MTTTRARQTRVAVAAALTVFVVTSIAQAHGIDPPQALSVVSSDANGPSLVRLVGGLARRRPEGWRYLCPVLWGDDPLALAQAIPDGPTVIGTSTGLFLMSDDDAVSPHGDPAAAGRVVALDVSAADLLALTVGEHTRLLAVHADAVRVLWSDPHRWADMTVGDEFVTLLRIESGRLYELQLSLTGEIIASQDAELIVPVSDVLARRAGTTPYVVLLSTTLTAELGRIEQGSWLALQTAAAIAGPLETADGRRFVALDGALARFDGEQLAPLPEAARVTCLRQQSSLRYACSHGGLRSVDADGLGPALFELSALREPDLTRVPVAQHDACSLQWQHFRVDLLQAGVAPNTPDAGVRAPTDAATDPADSAEAGVSWHDAGPRDQAHDAGPSHGGDAGLPEVGAEPGLLDTGAMPAAVVTDAGALAANEPPATSDGACQCRLGAVPPSSSWPAMLALLGCLGLRRARRPPL